MSDYGVTENGFVLKRLDTILTEIHSDLTAGYGFDTTVTRPSVLDTLVTTFANQIAGLWEVAQESYYSKFPTTAEGKNLDNAVQYGGITRAAAKATIYPCHCTGDDGTEIPVGTVIATDTKPETRLDCSTKFTISRSDCNSLKIRVATVEDAAYSVSINGSLISYSPESLTADAILTGLKAMIEAATSEYELTLADNVLTIADTDTSRSNAFVLSENLTTTSVTTIGMFGTEEYGKISLTTGTISKIITGIKGFNAVTNMLAPTYGRTEETDEELRKSYVAKIAMRATSMLDSIVSELLNNVDDVLSAAAYENDTDETSTDGLPPHSIEVVVEGGTSADIGEAILAKKAGGIQTYGTESVDVPTNYGQTITIKFSRPTYLYTWIKADVYGSGFPTNAASLVRQSLLDDTESLNAGEDLMTQTLYNGIYTTVSGLTNASIKVAYSTDAGYVPKDSEYTTDNIITTQREKILTAASRIEVTVHAS